MNDEVKMLRRALEDIQNAFANLWDHARDVPMPMINELVDANEHASFALRVTSGKLPPGYALQCIGEYYLPCLDDEHKTILDGASITDAFHAHLFIWEHYKQSEATQ